MGRWALPLILAPVAWQLAQATTCTGSFDVDGYGAVQLVNAEMNVPHKSMAASVDLLPNGTVLLRHNGRSYFADSCTEGKISHMDYQALNLLGKTIKYTVDLSTSGCGCNLAFYLTSMKQNSQVSDCRDYYCDANSICGVACVEIDIMEANQFAWHSTLHAADDKTGVAKGYGGGSGWNGQRDWTRAEYGPGAKCIDTTRPFQVRASFPVDAHGNLRAMEVALTQEGQDCPLSVSLDEYGSMEEVSRALEAGMTPVASYWSSSSMLWLDGEGADKQGPCASDDPKACPSALPKLSAFAIEDIGLPAQEAATLVQSCPGTTHLAGFGQIFLVNAVWYKPGDPTGRVQVIDGSIVPHMKGRTYFAHRCAEGSYNNSDFAALKLLGWRIQYTVDLSAADCGCNAKLYLASLKQNSQRSKCLDYYCDANKVCGTRCAEIDIMEANKHAFYTTLHTQEDGGGVRKGYGAMSNDWNASVYGPTSQCIDTTSPFQVSVSFPVDSDGSLKAVEVALSQPGKHCPLSLNIGTYNPSGREGMHELSQALAQGMTPIISFWGSGEDLAWLDGRGSNGIGPCDREDAAACGESVLLRDFSLEKLPPACGAGPCRGSSPGAPAALEAQSRAPVPSATPQSPQLEDSGQLASVLPDVLPAGTNAGPAQKVAWLPGANMVPSPTPVQSAGPYVFAGYFRPEAARYACTGSWRLAMPKAPEQQDLLRDALDKLIRAGHIANNWPKNTIWLGGYWNSQVGRWVWDDGTPIFFLKWATGQPSSALEQLREPWLCMVPDGHVHDSDPPYSFGVMCEQYSAPEVATQKAPTPEPSLSRAPSTTLAYSRGGVLDVQLHTPLPQPGLNTMIMKKDAARRDGSTRLVSEPFSARVIFVLPAIAWSVGLLAAMALLLRKHWWAHLPWRENGSWTFMPYFQLQQGLSGLEAHAASRGCRTAQLLGPDGSSTARAVAGWSAVR